MPSTTTAPVSTSYLPEPAMVSGSRVDSRLLQQKSKTGNLSCTRSLLPRLNAECSPECGSHPFESNRWKDVMSVQIQAISLAHSSPAVTSHFDNNGIVIHATDYCKLNLLLPTTFLLSSYIFYPEAVTLVYPSAK
jgi:hypothetical protein